MIGQLDEKIPLSDALVSLGFLRESRNGADVAVKAAKRIGLDIVGAEPRGMGVRFWISKSSFEIARGKFLDESNPLDAQFRKDVSSGISDSHVSAALKDLEFLVVYVRRAIYEIASDLNINLCRFCGRKLIDGDGTCHCCGADNK